MIIDSTWERIHVTAVSVVYHTICMSFACKSISIISTVTSHANLVWLRSLLYEVVVLWIEPSWLIHLTSRRMSWLCFLICSWNLFVSINAVHIFSNDFILTRKRLLLCLLLRSECSSSASNVSTVLLSVVSFLTAYVAVESVLMRATNTHLTLTQMLRILVKWFIRISSCLLRHSLLLTR